MKRTFSTLALALLVCAAAPAATIGTTLTVTNATGTSSVVGGEAPLSGPATLTNVGSGTFSSNYSKADTSGNTNNPYTIALAGGAGTITGTFYFPQSALKGGPLTGSATVTGGTGAYAGATGSFPSLTGSASSSGVTLTVNFTGAGTITTSGTVTPPAATPTITAVLNAASNTAGIAPGAIFIVKGSNLSATGYTPFAPPRPTVSSGVEVTFTPAAGGAGTDAYLVYLYNQSGVNQIACILPSTVAAGSYNVTVTNGAVSARVVAQVVANKIGLFTQDSSGGGLTSVQNYMSPGVVDLNRLTTGSVSGVTISPAKPGQPVIAYGTGLGGYAAGDNTASPAFDFSKTLNIQAVVGGVNIPVAYAGRAGYAGEDQINFTLPANIPTGCSVTLQISVNGNLSASTYISIAPDANSSACVQPGFTTAQLQKFDQGGTYTIGSFSLGQDSETVPKSGTFTSEYVGGSFSQFTGFQLASAAAQTAVITQSGSCLVIPPATPGPTSAAVNITNLDAGTVTITGPAGSSLTNQAIPEDSSHTYSYTSTVGPGLPGQAAFSIVPGTYTLKGAGGNDVGSFSTSITLGPPLTLTNPLPTTVTRSAGLTLNWTGGNATDLVEIMGSSSTVTGIGTNAVTTTTTEFVCTTTAGQGTFTVPASILNQLPAATAAQISAGTAVGTLEVASGIINSTFTASLKAGGSIDLGAFGSALIVTNTPEYQ
jgi:uncharacterized protein (TIGR03437 family)